MAPKTVLITGCSTGIGRALALVLAERGFLVYASARNVKSLDDLVSARIRPLALDVTDPASRQVALARIAADGAELDMLINNAGYGLMGPMAELEPEALRRQFETNLVAPLALVSAVVPGMAARKMGLIVNIGSISGIVATPFAGAYCASKAALRLASDTLRLELAPFGIQVVLVEPGGIASHFGASSKAQAQLPQNEHSLYKDLSAAIEKRTQMSQESPTSAEDFARALGRRLDCARPAPVIRLGHGSLTLPLLKRLLPTRALDRILAGRFGLRGLSARR